MSLLVMARSNVLLRYPITCFSNDSISFCGAFSAVEPFLGNKCLFQGALLVLKPDMTFSFFKYCSRSSILASNAPIFQLLWMEDCLLRTVFVKLFFFSSIVLG